MSSDPLSSRAVARLKLASPDDILNWSAGEVTKPDTLHPRSGKPIRGGLFCEEIFGPLQESRCRCGHLTGRARKRPCPRCFTPVLMRRGRRRRMGHIELACPVAHIWFVKARPSPLALLLDVRPTDVERIVQGETYLVLDGDRAGELLGRDEAEAADAPPSQTGAAALEEALRRIDLDALDAELRQRLSTMTGSAESSRRRHLLLRLRLLADLRRGGVCPDWMILRRLPVIGPGLRPIVRLDSGRHATSELNALYSRVIARNNRLRELLAQESPASILRIEQYQLQLAVDALLDNARCAQPMLGPRRRELRSLSDLLGSKQGRFRGNLLGKRVDYSARSVIVVGPELELHEVGLPAAIVLRLFEPLLLGRLRLEGWAQTLKRGQYLLDDLLHPERLIETARLIVRELVRLRLVAWAEQRGDEEKLRHELDTAEARATGRSVLDELTSQAIEELSKALPTEGRAAVRRRVHAILQARQEQLWDLVRRVITGHPVLLNRAPTLHRMGIQAFEPTLVSGNAIRLHPLVCKAFNADFDGDQMAVHLPLGEEGISEAFTRMTPAVNLFNPASGQPIVTPTQDVVLGCYYLTASGGRRPSESGAPLREPTPSARHEVPPPHQFVPPVTDHGTGTFADIDAVRLAHESGKLGLHARISVRRLGGLVVEEEDDQQVTPLPLSRRIDTTTGRALFNAVLPDGLPYYNFTLTARRLARILSDCHRKFGTRVTVETLDRIKELGLEWATRSGLSFSTDDIPIPRNKPAVLREAFARVENLKAKLNDGNIPPDDYPGHLLDVWDAASKRITQHLMPDLRHDHRAGRPYLNPLAAMADSGARGSPEQIRQLAALRGLMVGVSGKLIERPITSSLREGLRSWDYFVSAHGGRKGLTDKGVRTADAGYLTRKLVSAAQRVIVTEEDCGSLLGMRKRAPVGTLGGRVTGRVSLEDVSDGTEKILDAGELISPGQARRLAEMGLEELRVRSPLTCRARTGICRRCYGVDLSTKRLVEIGTAVGVIAAQSIGEPGTQLTLKVFQAGGIAGDDIVHDLDRVTRLLEISPVEDPVLLAPAAGEIHFVRYDEDSQVSQNCGWWLDDTGSDDLLRLCGREIRVKHGERVQAGEALCEGEADLRQMLALGGSALTGDFLLERVRRIYRHHRLDIDDRHFEVILSRLLGFVVVRDPGDTHLLPGEVLSRSALVLVNSALAEGQQPAYARTTLLSVSQAAARTEGFLAAAGFQRAVKILGEAALAARCDTLAGLNENVILGRTIPAGTGLESRR